MLCQRPISAQVSSYQTPYLACFLKSQMNDWSPLLFCAFLLKHSSNPFLSLIWLYMNDYRKAFLSPALFEFYNYHRFVCFYYKSNVCVLSIEHEMLSQQSDLLFFSNYNKRFY